MDRSELSRVVDRNAFMVDEKTNWARCAVSKFEIPLVTTNLKEKAHRFPMQWGK